MSTMPWREHYPEAADWDTPIATGTIPWLLDTALGTYADKSCIDFRERHIMFRELAAMADGFAAGLLHEGFGPGDSLAIYLPNTPWHPVSFFGTARAGVRIVNLSPLDAPRELAFKLQDSGVRTLMTTNFPGMLPTALRLLEEGAVDRVLVGEDEAWGPSPAAQPVPWSDAVRKPPHAAPPPAWPVLSQDDVCVLQYTGGTTGLPKGAMLSHRNLTAAVSMYQRLRDNPPRRAGEERAVTVLPLFHIYALTTLLLRGVAEGAELLLRARFDVPTLLNDIGQKRATLFAGVPTMWIALANHPDAAACDFSTLRSCGSGGAPLPFDVEQRVERLIGRQLRSGWGMTETSPAGTRMPPGAPSGPGVIGIPLPGIDLRIVDRLDPSKELPPGEAGELAIKGLNVFSGYWKRPQDTAAAFHDGYFLTGDIGSMDATGMFRILDRKKNMIISSGYNVYPAAVENAIYEHPDVAEAIVIGIPDVYRGQAAKAFVTLKPNAAELTLEALTAFLGDRLGRHEMPAALELRAALPRSPAGKLLAKVLLDEELAKAGKNGG